MVLSERASAYLVVVHVAQVAAVEVVREAFAEEVREAAVEVVERRVNRAARHGEHEQDDDLREVGAARRLTRRMNRRKLRFTIDFTMLPFIDAM